MTLHVLPLAALLIAGCISPSPAPPRRYFDAAVAPGDSSVSTVALGRLTAAPHLREEAMAWRLSPVELAFDEDNRWVAKPLDLLQHALEAAGFAEPSSATRLDVHLESFEGFLGDTPRARVVFVARLSGTSTATRRFDVEVPLERRSPDALAGGTSTALGQALSELSDWLHEEL